MRITEAFISERDNRAYEMRKAGLTFRQIGKALNISESTAHAAVKRAIGKINSRFALDHQAELQMEVERLDDLMRHLWPLTRPRDIEIDELDENGDRRKISVPPSLDAVDRVLKIAAQRAKLLGLDTVKLQIDSGGGMAHPELGAGKDTSEQTPKLEAMKLLKELEAAGVFEKAITQQIRRQLGDLDAGDIIDAEIVEDSDGVRELVSGEIVDEPSNEPPPWMEEDDDGDAIPEPWRPL